MTAELVKNEFNEQDPFAELDVLIGDSDDPKSELSDLAEKQDAFEGGGEEDEGAAEGDEDEEGEGEEEEETALEDDEDLTSYSKQVQKRIQRERRLRDEERQAAASALEKQFAAEQKLRAAALQQLQERQRYEERLRATQDDHLRSLEETAGYRMQLLQAQLLEAKNNADSTKEMQLAGELEELRFNKRRIDDVKGQLLQERQAAKARLDQQIQQLQQQPAQDVAPAKAIAWAHKNRAWLSKPENAPQVQFLGILEQQLQVEGFDSDSADYYSELDKRLHKTFPSLRKVGKQGSPPPKKKSSRARVAPVTASAQRNSNGKQRVVLTKSDIANMREFGLDPENKEDLRAYAAEKLKSSRGE